MKHIIIIIVIGLIMTIIISWAGVFNVAANEKHLSATTTFLEFVRKRSISVRSDNIKVPELETKELIQEGAAYYEEMCSSCHLSPGIEESELHSGLYPQPPVFSNNDYDNDPQAQFWVIKNGLKMTGMPAWYPAHNESQIWSMVAFIRKLKLMSADQYQELVNNYESGHIKNSTETSDNGLMNNLEHQH